MPKEISEATPIVVVGTGGSGTRAVVKFLSKCGVDMGQTTRGRDAEAFVDLLDHHINAVLELTRSCNYDLSALPGQLREEIVADYRKAAYNHRNEQNGSAMWGFKNPRHIFLLPLLNRALPKAKLVHLVRDGRDMLLSENKRQARLHFEPLFGERFADLPEFVARFWARTNLDAKIYGQTYLGNRYVNIRIEDLCGPRRDVHVARLAQSLGLEHDVAVAHAEVFELRESYGRGRSVAMDLDPVARSELCKALAAFEYTTTDEAP